MKHKIEDILLEDHGTLWMFRPVTKEALIWLQTHTDGQWFGNALAVEHRYVQGLADGLLAEGFTLA